MRSKAANFKHRWSAAKSRVPQGFLPAGFAGHARYPEGSAATGIMALLGGVALLCAANWLTTDVAAGEMRDRHFIDRIWTERARPLRLLLRQAGTALAGVMACHARRRQISDDLVVMAFRDSNQTTSYRRSPSASELKINEGFDLYVNEWQDDSDRGAVG